MIAQSGCKSQMHDNDWNMHVQTGYLYWQQSQTKQRLVLPHLLETDHRVAVVGQREFYHRFECTQFSWRKRERCDAYGLVASIVNEHGLVHVTKSQDIWKKIEYWTPVLWQLYRLLKLLRTIQLSQKSVINVEQREIVHTVEWLKKNHVPYDQTCK